MLRMQALVVACDVVDAETRSRVYRILPKLFPVMNETVYEMMFNVACCMGRYRVVLNLMNHPDVLDSIERLGLGNVVLYADERVFKWLFNSQKTVMYEDMEDVCKNVAQNKTMRHKHTLIQTWVLEHERCRTLKVTTRLLCSIAHHPLFIRMLHRAISNDWAMEDIEALFYELGSAPAQHLHAFLCTDIEGLIDFWQMRQFFRSLLTPENVNIVLDDPRLSLYQGAIHDIMCVENMPRDVFLTVLNHRRTTKEIINYCLLSRISDYYDNVDLYVHVFNHVHYCPTVDEARFMLRGQLWESLNLLMTDARISTKDTRALLLRDAQAMTIENELLVQPFMRSSVKKIKSKK